MAIKEYSFTGRDNEIVIGSSLTLSGITRMTCTLHPSGEVLDSDTAPDDINWTTTAITLRPGQTAATGSQDLEIVAYDPTHPNGQALAHPDGPTAMRVRVNIL